MIGQDNPKEVNAIKIKNVKNNKITELKVNGLFIAIGHDPATSLFQKSIKYGQRRIFNNKSGLY